jgi:adenylosuccinate lyase
MTYESALSSRYGSKTMRERFSNHQKYRLWRECWIALAQAQHDSGLDVTQEQIDEMKSQQDVFDWDQLERLETTLKHDVMAHIHHYAQLCPLAAPIIHLGATSAFVSDNSEMIQFHQALNELEDDLMLIRHQLMRFIMATAHVPTVGYTHYQVAQPTTIGKRFAMYLQDIDIALEELKFTQETLRTLGVKGTTGTQASFLSLVNNNEALAQDIEDKVMKTLGLKPLTITGQTYTRLMDIKICNTLEMIGAAAGKFAQDMRLMMHDGIVLEPFGQNQVGSSAMPYKRNPILSEKISGLSRKLILECTNASMTASTQWFERSLDDSSNRRLLMPEVFILTSEITQSMIKITQGCVLQVHVNDTLFKEHHVMLSIENILMALVQMGGDRQIWHETLRSISLYHRQHNTMDKFVETLQAQPGYNLTVHQLIDAMDPKKLVGLAPQQALNYVKESQERYD